MKKLLCIAFAMLCIAGINDAQAQKKGFIKVKGVDLVTPDGEKFFMRGTNLGNWLNPEGYMFRFGGTAASVRMIDQAFKEMVGPDFTNNFWKTFKDNYVTREDIQYLKQVGVNSIRVPFHYKLFTDEDYMGLSANQDGFERIDKLIEWCREANIYIILDMHDAPGGQTGDNIDDSYGYPWLFTSAESEKQFIDIWVKIADHYKNEPMILGYDLINEPIAPYFGNDMKMLNDALEPLYKKTVAAIRKVDKNHIMLLGGAQWNGNFSMLKDSKFDNNMMYTCHRYGGSTDKAAFQNFIKLRDSVNLPMYMGETGENTDEWVGSLARTLEQNNIGFHYWTYKRMGNAPSNRPDAKPLEPGIDGRSFVSIKAPADWNKIVEYTRAPRNSFGEIRKARPNQDSVKTILNEYLELTKFKNVQKNHGYIKALGLNP